MILSTKTYTTKQDRIPRVSGDDPLYAAGGDTEAGYSPRERG